MAPQREVARALPSILRMLDANLEWVGSAVKKTVSLDGTGREQHPVQHPQRIRVGPCPGAATRKQGWLIPAMHSALY
jgi:hypothetical protein